MCNLTIFYSVGTPIGQENLVDTLPTWGPSYRIFIELYINSFTVSNMAKGKWAEILRFTSTDNNCCNIGDRIPAIFTNKNGFIAINTQIGNKGSKFKAVPLEKETWYGLELLQYEWNNKVVIMWNKIYLMLLIIYAFSFSLKLFLMEKYWKNMKMRILSPSIMLKYGLLRQNMAFQQLMHLLEILSMKILVWFL